MTTIKKLVVVGALAISLAAVSTGLFAFRINGILQQELPIDGDGVSFEIRSGASFTSIANELAETGLLERPEIFRLYGRVTGKASNVRAGEYLIKPGSTMKSLIDEFVAGNVHLHSFTIVPGWTFRELIVAMSANPSINHTLEYEDWPAFLASLGVTYDHPEGLFLPETYRFPKATKDRDLLRQAYELMQSTLADEWAAKTSDLPLDTAYDALVLASIIEKETARADERARIAGVFVRRLQSGMRLQTDPTVIYGVGDAFDGNLTRRHLRTDTPYNTYTRGGLPPTPIALPGREAINAALHPEDGTEIYFVATGQGDGSHKFSETKEQHDAAVGEYLARQRASRRQQQGQ